MCEGNTSIQETEVTRERDKGTVKYSKVMKWKKR